jgi:hypothetical protein
MKLIVPKSGFSSGPPKYRYVNSLIRSNDVGSPLSDNYSSVSMAGKMIWPTFVRPVSSNKSIIMSIDSGHLTPDSGAPRWAIAAARLSTFGGAVCRGSCLSFLRSFPHGLPEILLG